MANVKKFKNTSVTRQTGERARLKVVQGTDFGSVFVLIAPSATIGRGEGNDIVLTDLKASRQHASLSQSPQGNWMLKDAGSSNGILFNGKSVREVQLKYNDVFTLGETTFEFISSEMATSVLKSPPKSAVAIQAEEQAFQAAREKIHKRFGKVLKTSLTPSTNLNPNPNQGEFKKGAKKHNPLFYGIGIFIIGLLLLSDGDKGHKKSNTQGDQDIRNLASYLPEGGVNNTAESIYKDGVREYFAHNYGRARAQFETVLQISPGHYLARLYQENCNKAIEDEVKSNLIYGKKSLESGKLKDAKGQFENIMRLLYRDQNNPNYKEAKVALTLIQAERVFRAGKLKEAKDQFEIVMKDFANDPNSPIYIEAKEQCEEVLAKLGGEGCKK